MVCTADVVGDIVSDVTDVGSEREAEVALRDVVAHVLRAVVRDGEGLDSEACYGEGFVDLDLTARGADRVLHEAAIGYAVVHQPRGVDGQVIDAPDDPDGTDMVGVVMRDDDPVDGTAIERYAFSLEGLGDSADRDPRIDEEAPRFVSYVVAVPTAPTGEAHKSYHSWIWV